MGKNYVPDSVRAFNEWFNVLVEYVVEHTAAGVIGRWEHIPQAEITALVGALEDWTEHYAPTIGQHTPAQRQGRDDARRRAVAVIRPFVQRFLMWPPVTNEDRVNMRLTVRDTTLTTIGAPTLAAQGEFTFPSVHVVEIRKLGPVGVEPGDTRAKHGFRIHFGVLGGVEKNIQSRIDMAPASGEELPHSIFTRRKRILFDFDGDSGKPIFVSIRYENSKGERGPFGPMMSAVIP